jgi:hypothetical protein
MKSPIWQNKTKPKSYFIKGNITDYSPKNDKKILLITSKRKFFIMFLNKIEEIW